MKAKEFYLLVNKEQIAPFLVAGITEHNRELVQKYQREMKLRKKYHNNLVELKGEGRFICLYTTVTN